MPLSNTKIRNLKPAEKTYKVSDEKGMYLEVTPKGGKRWRFKYRIGGKEKRISLGVYPDTGLKAAREKRDEARSLIADGVDPSARLRAGQPPRNEDGRTTLKDLAEEWWHHVHQHAVVESHAQRSKRRLEKHVYPSLGDRPVDEITPAEVLQILRPMEERGHAENAKRVKTLIGQIYRYGIPTGYTTRDITADLKDALRPSKPRHQPAITDPAELTPLLQAIDAYQGEPTTIIALKLSPILFPRPGELRHMRWADLYLAEGYWDYKPQKEGPPIYSPLSRQAVALLEEIRPLTGKGEYVFPAARGRGRPMSENTLNAALKTLGFGGKQVAHGFRATAKTMLAERLGYPNVYIEMQLGHAIRDPNGRAYDRTSYYDQRQAMMQDWADYLDRLRAEKDQ